jgi:dTMP kinase
VTPRFGKLRQWSDVLAAQRGVFFSFDGLDGVGKTTQRELFCQWLRERGHEVVNCVDPGTTALGELLRKILLSDRTTSIGPRSEMLLFMAARAQLVEEIILPALARGAVIVSDRFLLANVVYQGHAGGLEPAKVWEVGEMATQAVRPDLTFVLDMASADAARRIDRELDRMESRGETFQRALRQGYLAEAARNPTEIILVDAARPIQTIQSEIRNKAEQMLMYRANITGSARVPLAPPVLDDDQPH